MTKRSRRSHSVAFKAKVALASIKGEETREQLATRFAVHQNQITQWRGQLSTLNIELKKQFVNILTKFCKRLLPRLDEIYHWDEPDAVPPTFVQFKPEFDCSSAEWNILLKKALHRAWIKASANVDDQYDLADWTIDVWGGVSANKKETIEGYIEKASQNKKITTPFIGVASYSKLLAIAKPKKYVIFDARVAASLNAIQMLASKNMELPIKFPIPASRNPAINRFREHIDTMAPAMDVERGEAYHTYLEFVRSASANLGSVDIWRIEMLLFGLSIRLAREIMPTSVD